MVKGKSNSIDSEQKSIIVIAVTGTEAGGIKNAEGYLWIMAGDGAGQRLTLHSLLSCHDAGGCGHSKTEEHFIGYIVETCG